METNHYYKGTIANVGKAVFKVVDKTDDVYHVVFTPTSEINLQAVYIAKSSSAVEITKEEFLQTIKSLLTPLPN